MKVRVFYSYAPSENPSLIPEKREILSVVKELAQLRKELEDAPTQEKESIQRNITRLEQFIAIRKVTSCKPGGLDPRRVILAGKNPETYLGSDLGLLRKYGVDIAGLTLVRESNPAEAANSSAMKSGDTFIVNFGGNKDIAQKIGAGDILPAQVTKVTINGVQCERRNIPRPGYYDIKWEYQAIYDGYTIAIVERKDTIPESELQAANDAAEKRWQKIRTRDTINNNWVAITRLPEDVWLEKMAQEEMSNMQKYWTINFDINEIGEWDYGLLKFISIAEWTWNNYNAIYGNAGQYEEKFTEMTLDQILNYQRRYTKWRWSAAIWRYQFMTATLEWMMDKYQISGSTIFSKETQDRLAFLKLNERWLQDFKAWRMLKRDFQLNLAAEWAAIAKDASWLSYHNGDRMNNKSSEAWRQVVQVLDKLYGNKA